MNNQQNFNNNSNNVQINPPEVFNESMPDGNMNNGQNINNQNDFDVEKYKKRNRIIIIITSIFALIAIVLIVLLLLKNCTNWLDPKASKSAFDTSRDLNTEMKDNMMRCTINETITFPNGTNNEGSAGIKNSSDNRYDQKITIVLEDGQELYRTDGALSPGYEVENIKSEVSLNPGSYKATAIFDAYDEYRIKVGTTEAEVTVKVS